jgi:alkylation response protein AidB-like acyl-CoA dehydrogenase
MTTLEAVRLLSDEVAARAPETEAARSVPDDLVARIGRAGVFRMFVPRSLGGPEVDPVTACAVIEELSRADGSTGWTSMILNTSFFSCWLDPAVAREILDREPGSGMAGLFGPIGRAEPAGDGAVRLSGRFPFNSGSPHASWFCEGALLTRDGSPPEWRFMFVPREEVEVLDTWHVAGLRGTASHDVVIQSALVPLERTANPIFETAPQDAPHFRWSFFALLASLIAAVPLGVARRSLDEFVALAGTKGRGSTEPLATEQVVQLTVARDEGLLRAARSLLFESVESAWQTSLTGDPISREQRLAIRIAATNAMRAGIEVVDSVFALAGGGALYDDSPLQRGWRDLHAASSHIFFSNSFVSLGGQVLLGQPAEDFRM